MKNRKFIVVAFVLVAALLVGVGYAALTDVLTINGNMATDPSTANADFDAKVYFANASVKSDTTGNNATANIVNTETDSRDTAVIECHAFKVAGQTVTAFLTIQNDHAEFDALITPKVLNEDGATLIVTSGTQDHDPVFSATWEWADASGQGLGTTDAKTVTANGGMQYILVTITLDETPTDVHTASFTVTLDVSHVANNAPQE